MGALVKAGQQLPAEQQAAAEQQQYLTFVLGGEMFAIGILCVKEIIEYGDLTVVPMMPECIRGVINLRGAVVPVVDLACRFGRRSTDLTRRTCIVIVEVEGEGERQDIGVIVDAVSEVLEIQSSQIEPAPAFGARIRTDFIHGMGKLDGKFVIILNVNKVLSLDDLALLGQMVGQESADALTAAA
ncbi:MAG: chemotaxis protein CheW [Denitratisoma sp.]|nr:chemotaxis protein CheW [Denitratisoma sp.]